MSDWFSPGELLSDWFAPGELLSDWFCVLTGQHSSKSLLMGETFFE